jgi:hypothetical protein
MRVVRALVATLMAATLLCAALAATGLAADPASGAVARQAKHRHKRRCKRKAKHSAVSAGHRRRCKQKRKKGTSRSRVRVSLTWDSGDDVDLFLIDNSDGFYAWWGLPAGISNGRLTDSRAWGPETYKEVAYPGDDLVYEPLTVWACLYSSAGADHDVHAVAHIVDPGGAARDVPVTLRGQGDSALLTTSPTSSPAYDYDYDSQICLQDQKG